MTSSSTEDSLVRQAVSKLVEDEEVSLDVILKTLAPKNHQDVAPADAPLPVRITKKQREALDQLPSVFGSVVPVERRLLQEEEVTSLIEERMTLDEVGKLAADRKESIRTTIFNHLDVEAEESGVTEVVDERDDRGHYKIPGQVHSPDHAKMFSREIRDQAPAISIAVLEELADDPDYPQFTRDDFLAMTTQTRVIDENKIMIRLRKSPGLVEAIALATVPGKRVASLNLRNAK